MTTIGNASSEQSGSGSRQERLTPHEAPIIDAAIRAGDASLHGIYARLVRMMDEAARAQQQADAQRFGGYTVAHEVQTLDFRPETSAAYQQPQPMQVETQNDFAQWEQQAAQSSQANDFAQWEAEFTPEQQASAAISEAVMESETYARPEYLNQDAVLRAQQLVDAAIRQQEQELQDA